MSSLRDLHCESQEATSHKPGSWAESVTLNAPKPRLPPLREILPAARFDDRPPDLLQRPCNIQQPVLQSYYLPFRRAKDDIIKMPFTMIKPENEAIYSTTRKTVQGKTLTYTLNVKQQPERARACGAGARGELLLASSTMIATIH
jgi:hypothetical protein